MPVNRGKEKHKNEPEMQNQSCLFCVIAKKAFTGRKNLPFK